MILLVTGTDTGVGKTAVSASLLWAARRRGWPVRGVKPVESGCESGPEGLIPLDATELGRAAGHEPLCHARFAEPVSPARAAALAGQRLELRDLVEYARAQAGPGLTVVEGAGGLLAPLADAALFVDFAQALAAPVLVVARDALGTINHTLLTVEAARTRDLDVVGVVLSSPAERSTAEANAEQIRRYGRVPTWSVPFADRAERADALEPVLDALASHHGVGIPPGTGTATS